MGKDRKEFGHKTIVSEKKKKELDNLAGQIRNYNTIAISFISNIPSNQLQIIRKKLKGKAKILVVKRRIMIRALDKCGINEIKKLKNHLGESSTIIFSNEDPFILASILADNKTPSKAKTGQISKKEIKL